jgi:hypothetical protein
MSPEDAPINSNINRDGTQRVSSYRLLTRDSARYRAYFPKLSVDRSGLI